MRNLVLLREKFLIRDPEKVNNKTNKSNQKNIEKDFKVIFIEGMVTSPFSQNF